MTLPRWEVIQDQWAKRPPLSVSAWSIAQSMGAKMKVDAKTAAAKGNENVGGPQALAELLGAAGGFGSRKPEWLTT